MQAASSLATATVATPAHHTPPPSTAFHGCHHVPGWRTTSHLVPVASCRTTGSHPPFLPLPPLTPSNRGREQGSSSDGGRGWSTHTHSLTLLCVSYKLTPSLSPPLSVSTTSPLISLPMILGTQYHTTNHPLPTTTHHSLLSSPLLLPPLSPLFLSYPYQSCSINHPCTNLRPHPQLENHTVRHNPTIRTVRPCVDVSSACGWARRPANVGYRTG